MDSLRRDDIERARKTQPAEKARQTFDLIRTGIRLHRAALRDRMPSATEDEIEAALRRWLLRQ